MHILNFKINLKDNAKKFKHTLKNFLCDIQVAIFSEQFTSIRRTRVIKNNSPQLKKHFNWGIMLYE